MADSSHPTLVGFRSFIVTSLVALALSLAIGEQSTY